MVENIEMKSICLYFGWNKYLFWINLYFLDKREQKKDMDLTLDGNFEGGEENANRYSEHPRILYEDENSGNIFKMKID